MSSSFVGVEFAETGSDEKSIELVAAKRTFCSTSIFSFISEPRNCRHSASNSQCSPPRHLSQFEYSQPSAEFNVSRNSISRSQCSPFTDDLNDLNIITPRAITSHNTLPPSTSSIISEPRDSRHSASRSQCSPPRH